MSFGNDDFLFNNYSENIFNEDTPLFKIFGENTSPHNSLYFENEERTNLINEEDHYL